MRFAWIAALQFAGAALAWFPKDVGFFSNDANETIVDGVRTFKNRRQIYGQEIRGVNLGSLFIVEPWMMSDSWKKMGCGDLKSEFDCVSRLGQDQANKVFSDHWDSWITSGDLDEMKTYGINTIRIPIGYWMKEDVVFKDSEHFPQGGFAKLQRLCGWAADRGMFVILDLHGSPGAQAKQNAFTGQNAPTAGFFVDWQYKRAYEVLAWLATNVHKTNEFRSVGVIEVINEPDRGAPSSLVTDFYPGAMRAIRYIEASLGISADKGLHVMFPDGKWGAGDPNTAIKDIITNAAYDDHRYIKWDTSVALNKGSYLHASCHDDLGGNWPLIIGEWSLSPADSVENSAEFDKDANKAWYRQWWAAQVLAYEKQNGWVYWSWKTELGDYRWSYQEAVKAGVADKDPGAAQGINPCAGV